MTYTLAAIDLDGTLLGDDHALSVTNARAVRRVSDGGASVVLASGRQWHTIRGFAAQIGLPPDAPIVAYNGAMVRTLGGETWLHAPVPVRAADEIVRDCAALGCHLNYYLDDVLYVRDDTPWGRLYAARTGTEAQVVGDLTRFDGRQPTKLLLIDTPETTDRLLARALKRYGQSLYITKTDDEYLEFMDPGVSKGAALAFVADRLGRTARECVVFGDSFNDVPMLRWAEEGGGVGVAMENARPAVKAASGRVAPANSADGVASVLDDLFDDLLPG